MPRLRWSRWGRPREVKREVRSEKILHTFPDHVNLSAVGPQIGATIVDRDLPTCSNKSYRQVAVLTDQFGWPPYKVRRPPRMPILPPDSVPKVAAVTW